MSESKSGGDASPAWGKGIGRSGVPSRKCNGRTVIRHKHDEDGHRKGDPILDEDGRRQYRPCEAWAANGTEYCGNHGGSAPQTINAAKRDLALAAHNAVLGMIATALDERVPHETRLKAQAQILDRIGVRAGVDVGLETPAWQKLLGDMFGMQPSNQDEPERYSGEDVVKARVRKLAPPKAAPPAAKPARKAAKPSAKPKFEGW